MYWLMNSQCTDYNEEPNLISDKPLNWVKIASYKCRHLSAKDDSRCWMQALFMKKSHILAHENYITLCISDFASKVLNKPPLNAWLCK